MNNARPAALGYERILLTVLIVAAVALNFVWIILDERPQPFIDSYPESTIQFVDKLQDENFELSELPRNIARLAHGPRPPLYQLAAAPFVAFFERSASSDAMLIVNTLALVVLLFATYKLAELVMGKQAGLLAALLVITYPPILNLAKIARPHAIVPAAVALTVWLLFELLLRRSYKTLWMFSVAMAAAFLIHPSSVNLLAVPVTVLTIYLAFFQTRPRFPDSVRLFPRWIGSKLSDPFVYKGMLPALGIAVSVSGGWYVLKLRQALALMERSAEQWAGNRLGFYDLPTTFWWYLQTLPGVISTFFAYLLGFSIVAAIAFKSRANKVLYALLLALLVLMYCIAATRSGTLGWMNFSAALPIAAVLTAVGVMVIVERLRFVPDSNSEGAPTWVRSASSFRSLAAGTLLAVFVSMALLNYSIVAWGVPGADVVLRALGSPLERACGWRMNVAFCANPPSREDWQIERILGIVMETPKCQQSKCELVVLVQHPDYFSNAALRRGHLRKYPDTTLDISRSGGLLVRSVDINWLTADFFVYLLEGSPTEYQKAVTQLIEAPPAAFDRHYQRIGDYSLPNGRTVRLIRRTEPLNREQSMALINALDVSEATKRQLLDLLESEAAPDG